jgi:hypothetical protein
MSDAKSRHKDLVEALESRTASLMGLIEEPAKLETQMAILLAQIRVGHTVVQRAIELEEQIEAVDLLRERTTGPRAKTLEQRHDALKAERATWAVAFDQVLSRLKRS